MVDTMTFWLVLGLMTAAALGAVVWPFIRRPSAGTGGSDLAVYRDQLEEIDRDRNEGSIGPAEAEAARVEVSRRLLAAADVAAAAGKEGPAGFSARRWLAAALVLALPLGAVSLYLRYGSPDLPAQPLAERIARAHAAGGVGGVAGNATDPEAAQLVALVAKVEAHLATNPEDGRGWEVLAPVYMRLDRYDDAIKAHRNAIRLLGPSPDRVADLGESLVAAADGMVTPEARAEFERARKMEADNVTAGFYLGLAAKQAGQRDEAQRIWQDMITRAPAGATWVAFFQRALAGIDGKSEEAFAAPAPAPASLEPPEELPPEQREMARGMVERLAERLKQDGSDPEAWLRLIRSYMVMAERDTAREALADGRRVLANAPDKLKRLNDGVRQLGLEGGVLAALQGAAPASPPAAAAPLPPAHPPVAPPAASAPPAMAGPMASAAPGGLAPEQNDMVRGMIDRLATRLKENGSDVDGWLRLLRSYMVLGDRDKAKAAAGDARRALSAEPDKLNRLEDGVKELGIES